MNLLLRIIVISIVIVLSEAYFYLLLKNFFLAEKEKGKIRLLKIFCIIFPICFVVFELGVYYFVGYPEDNYIKYRQLFLVLDTFILVYIPKLLTAAILMIFDILRFLYIYLIKLTRGEKKHSNRKIIYKIALVIYLAVLVYTVYGFVYEKSNYTVQKADITFKNLPKSFEGFKIAQISDLHLGSFTNTKTLEKVFKMIKDLKPDILFMTGDLINVSYKEVLPYINDFNSINPPYGKFSILGNHDIGDYFSLKFPKKQKWLTEQLIQTEKQAGFRLLIDTSVYIHKGKDSIALIGVNNWGTFPFKQTGDLKKAMKSTNSSDFKILLSHDPDHWSKEVKEKTNIDLTFSGHTHAMQLAFICGKIKISPSAFKYKNWYGLYSNAEQYLYVNPGLGFSGFSGRIGTRPEITLITLHCSK